MDLVPSRTSEPVPMKTLADVLVMVAAGAQGTRRRDLTSAVERISAMMGGSPATIFADVGQLRPKLNTIRPAAHDISKKTYANHRSLFVQALALAGVVDVIQRGRAGRDVVWRPVMDLVARERRLSIGLASFANWCASNGIDPGQVTNDAIEQFLSWLTSRTLVRNQNDLARRTATLWNEAAGRIAGWPKRRLAVPSFAKARKRLRWEEMPSTLQAEADAYLEYRRNPDLFGEGPNIPSRPLAESTLRLQRSIS